MIGDGIDGEGSDLVELRVVICSVSVLAEKDFDLASVVLVEGVYDRPVAGGVGNKIEVFVDAFVVIF